MKFGPVPTDKAVGTTLAHTLRAGHRVIKKGRILDAGGSGDAASSRVLRAHRRADPAGRPRRGFPAAAAVANAIAGVNVRVEDSATGRANLFAETAGLVMIDAARVHALNARNEAITCATLVPFAPVRRGDMVATVKLIPFAVHRESVVAAAIAGRASIAIRPWRGVRVGLVTTRGAHDIEHVAAVQRQRVASLGGALIAERTADHETAPVASAIRELVFDLGLDSCSCSARPR